MEGLVDKYGAAHVVNLLSDMKTSEMELTHLYQQHLKNSPLYDQGEQNQDVPGLIHCTNYDFHTQTKTGGYDEAQNIRRFVNSSANSFNYFYMVDDSHHSEKQPTNDPQVITQQKGVFRTNCLDCLDRTNLVQGIFSRMALEHFFDKRHEFVGQEFWMRHQTLWADNGDVSGLIALHRNQY